MNEHQGNMTAKEVFIEKDAVKEPPEEEGEYFVTYTNDIGRQFDGTMIYSFEFGRWDIQKGFRVISYLVKQSQPVQGFTEQDVKEMLDYAITRYCEPSLVVNKDSITAEIIKIHKPKGE